MSALAELAPRVGVVAAASALGVARATFYRQQAGERIGPAAEPVSRRVPRRLSDAERSSVLAVLHSEEFIDMAPAAIRAVLLDRNDYLCSTRTMYRILHDHAEVRERRNQARRPVYAKPELVATGPNQVWSWDITKLRGPYRSCHYALYVILDIYSRYVVGWTIATGEDSMLATKLIEETCEKQRIQPGALTIHADRGSAMTSKPVASLLTDLQITRSHSRPYVSDDNPFSEAGFKTLKYRPDFPDRFGCLEDARAFCRAFFDWYNGHHRHSGIAMFTPETVHHGLVEEVLEVRGAALAQAYAAHPERFPGGPPRPARPPEVVWINPPASASTADVSVVGAPAEHGPMPHR